MEMFELKGKIEDKEKGDIKTFCSFVPSKVNKNSIVFISGQRRKLNLSGLSTAVMLDRKHVFKIVKYLIAWLKETK